MISYLNPFLFHLDCLEIVIEDRR